MINPMDLTGKHILITGASSGIGKATAIHLSKLGAKLSLIARDEERLKDTLNQLDGERHFIYLADLKDIQKIEGLVGEIVGVSGAFDGLVHCAGIAPMRPLTMTKHKFLNEVMTINFYAFVELVRCVSKKNNCKENSSIVGISSVASRKGDKSKIAYCASKAAMDGAIRCMARELTTKRIRVNSIMPAFVSTEMYTDFVHIHGEAEDSKRTLEQQYHGITEPIEIANAVAFLLCDLSKTITGTSIVVDGGALS